MMGQPMAATLVAAGFDVVVHDARRERAQPLLGTGAEWAVDAEAAARAASIVCTSLPGPDDVFDVVAGPHGTLRAAQPGDVHVDLTTSSLPMVRHLAASARARGVEFVDAPVSGGTTRAKDGSLTIMASGTDDAYARAAPVLAALAKRVFRVGREPGAGTLVKLLNNAIGLCSNLLSQEVFVVAAKAGLDVNEFLEVLEASSAAPFLPAARLVLSGDFELRDVGMTLRLAEKDVRLAHESAVDLDVETPLIAAAQLVYAAGVDAGYGESVYYATLRVLAERAGIEPPQLG
jgi:3-hydroxyisobutyrate dehydrogenase